MDFRCWLHIIVLIFIIIFSMTCVIIIRILEDNPSAVPKKGVTRKVRL